MPRYNMPSEEDIRKLMLLKDKDCHQALYESYCCQIYGQFFSFCSERAKAYELTKKVFEIAGLELENGGPAQGKLLIWLINIARQVSREYLVDFSVKKINGSPCIRRLVISEGFTIREAANILGLSIQEARVTLRQKLKG